MNHVISYYPTYSILDEIVNYNNYKTLNLFLDLKNISQMLYMQHCIETIVENTLKTSKIDTSVFDSLVSFLSFHKIYAAKRNIKINFFIFFESGQSFYHLNISKKYKISRRIDTLYGLDKEKRDLFFTVLQKNFMLIEKVFNKIPNTKVIRLPNFEADFVPFLITTRNLVEQNSSIANVIYSNDHDMLQFINDHCYIFSKTPKCKKIIKKGMVMSEYLKENSQFPDEWFTFAMSINGDSCDDVDSAVKGIGVKTISKNLNELVSCVGGIDSLYNNVCAGKDIFCSNLDKDQNKNILKIIESETNDKAISRNLKLVSFEVISRHFEDPPKTEILEKRDYLLETVNNNQFVDFETMVKALTKSGIHVDGELFSNLYFGV
jgi:hypothetical protein